MYMCIVIVRLGLRIVNYHAIEISSWELNWSVDEIINDHSQTHPRTCHLATLTNTISPAEYSKTWKYVYEIQARYGSRYAKGKQLSLFSPVLRTLFQCYLYLDRILILSALLIGSRALQILHGWVFWKTFSLEWVQNKSPSKNKRKNLVLKKKSYLLTLDWSISCNKFELRVKSNQSYEAQYSSVQSLSSEL